MRLLPGTGVCPNDLVAPGALRLSPTASVIQNACLHELLDCGLNFDLGFGRIHRLVFSCNVKSPRLALML
jgi:hypothetical protein